MATTTTQLDRSVVRDRVLSIVRGLLQELGSHGALPILSPTAHLDRDLGLGSLERVELMDRLETEFGVRLTDRVAAEANTPEDLMRAILDARESSVEEEAYSGLHASALTQKLHRQAAGADISAAETLLEVLRFRATHEGQRTHLLITEDADGAERSRTLTFGELYAAGQRCAAELARRVVGTTQGRKARFSYLREGTGRTDIITGPDAGSSTRSD